MVIIGDIDGVVGGERLEFREEQVQCVGKKGNEEEQHVLAAFALLGEVISDHHQVELKGNQDAGLITESAVLEINEAGEFANFTGRFVKFRKPKKKRYENEARICERMGSNGRNSRS